MSKTFWIAVLGVVLLESQSAYAVNVEACKDALVRATYNRLSSRTVDRRMASLVTEGEYDTAKASGGASAYIYGLPAGANYSDYHELARKVSDSYNDSLSTTDFANEAWTGLDSSSANTYTTCLNTLLYSSSGIHLYVKAATASDVSIVVEWHPAGGTLQPTALSWVKASSINFTLPAEVTVGPTTIIIPRPTSEIQLGVNAPGTTDSIILEPLPPPPTTYPHEIVLTPRGTTDAPVYLDGLVIPQPPDPQAGRLVCPDGIHDGLIAENKIIGSQPSAEWFPTGVAPGNYKVTITYASQASRPLDIIVDDGLSLRNAASEPTGSSPTAFNCPEAKSVVVQGELNITHSTPSIKLEPSNGSQAWPHVFLVKLDPVRG